MSNKTIAVVGIAALAVFMILFGVSLTTQVAEMGYLKARVAQLEGSTEQAPGLELIYDSGWITVNSGSSQNIHTLDNDNVIVYMVGRSETMESTQIFYGGTDYSGERVGAAWIISGTQLGVTRFPGDVYYEEVRVLVWQLP